VFRGGASWKTLRDELAAKHGDASDFPVRGIDYNSASKYCEWRHQRLPSGDEWEFVARGPARHIFANGDQPPAPDPAAASELLPVNAQQPSGRFGNRGLGGELWEWVSDGKPSERVLRGASWRDRSPVNQRLATRRLEDPTHAYVDTGMRCARSAAQWPEAAP
jgi:formylglycine-generating enzyme required for sulfatase activity